MAGLDELLQEHKLFYFDNISISYLTYFDSQLNNHQGYMFRFCGSFAFVMDATD